MKLLPILVPPFPLLGIPSELHYVLHAYEDTKPASCLHSYVLYRVCHFGLCYLFTRLMACGPVAWVGAAVADGCSFPLLLEVLAPLVGASSPAT